jgi:hypothetical protein
MQVYILEADLMGRTVGFKNMNGELVAIAAKSTKALILSQVWQAPLPMCIAHPRRALLLDLHTL